MNTAIWGLIGTLFGGAISFVGQLVVHYLSASDRKDKERAEDARQLRDQRKQAYLRLLTVARQLRYHARSPHEADPEHIESLRMELASVTYEVELISSSEMGIRGRVVRLRTMDYWNTALSSAKSESDPDLDDQREIVETARLEARQAVGDFIRSAQDDLK